MDRNNTSTSLKALERSTYRSLQKTAKLMCLPANVKKSCLINLIYTKTHKSEYDLDILLEAIKQERATYSAHCKAKQGHLIQAAEVSSTSSIKSPIRPSRYLRQSPIRYSPESSVSSKSSHVSKTITKVASPSQKKSITNQTSSYKSPNVNLGKYYAPKTKSRLNVSESQNMHTTLNSYSNITSGRILRSDHKSMEVVNINNVVNGSAREMIRREENKKTILTVIGTNGTKRIRLTAYKKSDKVEDNKNEVVQVTNEKTPTSTRKRKISGISPLTSPHSASTQQQTTANNTPDLSLDLLGSDLCNTEHILSESALHESFPNLSAVTDDLDSTMQFDVFNATVEPPRRQDGVYSAHQPTTKSGTFDTQLVYTAQATVTSVAQVLDTCTENNASCQRTDNAYYPNGAGCLTLYELWNNGDQTTLQQELICREMMAVSPFDFLGIQDLGANVTVPELVEDAMELISQDGDYLERIDMEYKLQCILCDWNGPKFMLEFHIRQDHSSDILKTNTKNWNITYTLGSLTKDQWISKVTEYNTKLYVLSAKCEDSDKLMASLNVLSYEENENISKGKITIYNKITGDPVEWSGHILQYPDNQPIRYQDNCLTTSLTKLNVLSERESLNKLSTTQRHLYDIQITFFIDLY